MVDKSKPQINKNNNKDNAGENIIINENNAIAGTVAG